MPTAGTNLGKRLVAGIPSLWLLVLFAIPFIIVLKISFSEVRLAMPPYAPLFDTRDGQPVAVHLHLSNYGFLFTDPLYIRSYLYSLQVAAVSTLVCLLIGYPMAYAIARSSPTSRSMKSGPELPLLGSNQDSSAPEADVLPVTPRG